MLLQIQDPLQGRPGEFPEPCLLFPHHAALQFQILEFITLFFVGFIESISHHVGPIVNGLLHVFELSLSAFIQFAQLQVHLVMHFALRL